jgi:hypothetical protein
VLERMSDVFLGCDIMMRGAGLFVMGVKPVVGVSALYKIGCIIKCYLPLQRRVTPDPKRSPTYPQLSLVFYSHLYS